MVALVILALIPNLAEEFSLRVIVGKAIPSRGATITWKLGKEAKTVADFDQPIPLPGAGPYELQFTPKGGVPVVMVIGWKAKPGENALLLSDYLGTAIVLGDDLPRADAIVLTAESDPGPGEKGHIAIQKVKDYKQDLVAPPGFYSVWIVPSTGAKSQRIAERIRILAGRETRVGD